MRDAGICKEARRAAEMTGRNAKSEWGDHGEMVESESVLRSVESCGNFARGAGGG